jgi:hypothetical protein
VHGEPYQEGGYLVVNAAQTEMFSNVQGVLTASEFARRGIAAQRTVDRLTEEANDQSRAPDPLRGMVHRSDPGPSRRAAAEMKAHFTETKLHAAVLAAFRDGGPMTDGELEKLAVFDSYGPSTIRKRRSELYQAGKLDKAGERTNERGKLMTIWRAKQ